MYVVKTSSTVSNYAVDWNCPRAKAELYFRGYKTLSNANFIYALWEKGQRYLIALEKREPPCVPHWQIAQGYFSTPPK